MRYIAVDTETTLIPPQGTDKVNTRRHVPDLIVTTYSAGHADSMKDRGYLGHVNAELFMWYQEEEHHKLFANDDCYFCFHNVAFDLAVLTKAFPTLKPRFEELVRDGRILDTRVMYLLRDPDPRDKSITLAYLSQKLLGKVMEKGAVRTSFRRDMQISADQREYAIKDAVITREIAEHLRKLPLGCFRACWGPPPPNRLIATEAKTDFRHPDIEYSSAAAWLSWQLKPVGMAIDPDTLSNLYFQYKQKVSQLQASLVEADLARIQRMPKTKVKEVTVDDPSFYERSWTKHTMNPPTMRRLWRGVVEEVEGKVVKNQGDIRAVFELFAKEIEITAPTSGTLGNISMKRDDWKEYVELMPTKLKLFMAYQRAHKYLTAFLQPLRDARATEVMADYWVPGAATGRWACSKPNLQQVPGALRSIYKARPGKVFVYADYPTLELYTLAHSMHCLGIDGPLMEALKSGEDIHTRTAALMYGKELSAVSPEERQAAKAANFGLPGGMGVRRLFLQGKNMGIKWDMKKTYEIRNRWFSTFPDIKQFLRLLEVNPYKQLKPPGMETTEWLQRLGFNTDDTWPTAFDLIRKINKGAIFTVVLPSGRTIPDRGYSAAANCFFQGPGADTITRAFNNVCENDINPVAVVHDSITIECPEEDAEHKGRLLTACMADALVTVCPSVPYPTIDFEVTKVWK